MRMQGCRYRGSQIIVQVVDTCATCGPTDINIPYNTFQTNLASPSKGNLGILYQQVCSDRVLLGKLRPLC